MTYSKDFAVIFDMDGVLVNSNPAHKIALEQFCAKYGFSLTEKELKEKIYGRTNRAWLTNLFGELSEEKLNEYAQEKEALYRKIFTPTIAPVKGLLEYLDELYQANIMMVIGTSAPPENVIFTLENTKSEKYFTHILDDTFVTHGKPNPEIYLKAVAKTGLEAKQCIVIEDSLSGVEAGQKAGCKVIGITTTHLREELQHTDLIINDFSDLTFNTTRELIL